jgi:hypothetical protein
MIHQKISYVSLLVLSLVFAGCGTSPEEIAQIVEQTVEARPPIVEVMEETVEVTRIVEVSVETEVTRLVEIETTLEVMVEVTRVVEVQITSTPEPTLTPTATPIPQPTAVQEQNNNQGDSGTDSGDINAEVLAHLEYVKSRLDDYRSNLGGSINCRIEIAIVDELTVIRQFDLTTATSETQNAYNNYVSGITVFQQGTQDLNTHCRDFLAENSTSSSQVTGDKYSFALNGVEEAVTILRNAIQSLGGNVDA